MPRPITNSAAEHGMNWTDERCFGMLLSTVFFPLDCFWEAGADLGRHGGDGPWRRIMTRRQLFVRSALRSFPTFQAVSRHSLRLAGGLRPATTLHQYHAGVTPLLGHIKDQNWLLWPILKDFHRGSAGFVPQAGST